MLSVENYASQEINTLISKCEKLELDIYVDDVSYSVDFFATIAGKRKQCMDMIDEGLIDEKCFDSVAKSIAEYARSSEGYKKGAVNRYSNVSKLELQNWI